MENEAAAGRPRPRLTPPPRRIPVPAASAAAEQAHAFPYMPTQILTPSACVNQSSCRGRDVAYLFSPSSDGVRFLALNYSSGIDANAEPKSVSTTLPFLENAGSTAAFGAARAANGEVLVFAGACDGPGGDVWSYTPGGDDDAKWERRTTTMDKGAQKGKHARAILFRRHARLLVQAGAHHGRANIIHIRRHVHAAVDGQHAGVAVGRKLHQDDDEAHAGRRRQPGQLQPGRGVGVGPALALCGLLGDAAAAVHDQHVRVRDAAGQLRLPGRAHAVAFINMSTAAVWSLPEETWSYINVQPPLATGEKMPGNELAKNQNQQKQGQVQNQDSSSDGAGLRRKRDGGAAPDNVYSRSGHTAVLSEDGSSVVILGGWVGDVGTPAEPQLAVLEMSQAYSSWRWRIPEKQPDGGIYGHGAAMLPGNVMVVYGGWETKTTTTKQKRQDASSLRFYNLTSMAWTSSYTNPNAASGDGSGGNGESHDAPGSGGSSKSKRLGLGLGLGLGLALLLGIIFCFLLWRMRQRRKQARHDEAVRAMAEDARHFLHDTDMIERDDFLFGWGGQRDWRNSGQQQSGGRSLGYESLRGAGAGRSSIDAGAGGPGPIARKPVAGVARGMRNGYQPALPDAGRFSSTFASPPGVIHPILEDDEDDPERRSNSSSPARRTDPDVQDWVSDVDAADALLERYSTTRQQQQQQQQQSQGRVSPTRRGSNRSTLTLGGLRDDDSRTGSNLSESARSAADSLRRSASGRRSAAGGFLLGLGLGAGAGEHSKPGSSSSSSYNTARSGFGALQAEAPGLLMGGSGGGGARTPASPTGWGGAAGDDDDYALVPREPGSPSKSKPPSRRTWLGSCGASSPAAAAATARRRPTRRARSLITSTSGTTSSRAVAAAR
ncbi:hypothetical protein ACCO45_011803 [Purpureocillium lilacinum]|uniref:Uncharacterized protein n=1 Tax=Purpureocillium lilacinum TaxID=33203 RepID=A0ACC4DCG0_PURLI